MEFYIHFWCMELGENYMGRLLGASSLFTFFFGNLSELGKCILNSLCTLTRYP